MGDAASFTVALDDKITPGAKAGSASLGQLDGSLRKTGSGLSKLGDLAAGAAVAIGTAIAASAVAAGVALVDMTIKATEAQNAQLALAKAEYGSEKAARAIVNAEYAVSSASAETQDQIFDLSARLERAGVSAGQFKSSLQAMADTASVAGEQATKPIEKVLKKVEQLGKFEIKDTDLKGSGIKISEVYDELATKLGKSSQQIATDIKLGRISAEDGIAALNSALEKKFGDAAKDKMLDLNVQLSKAKENFSNMLKDVDTKPLGKALQQSLSFLNANSKSGKALRAVLTGAMSGFFKAAASAIPYVERFFLGLGIAALDTYIAFKKPYAELTKFLGLSDSKSADSLKAVGSAGKVVGFVLSSMVVGLAAIWTVGAASFSGLAKAAGKLPAAWKAITSGIGKVYTEIKGGLSKAVDYLKGLPQDFTDAGNAMIDGLIAAIKSGASKVASAVTDMAQGATKAAKAALGIHSPSKVFHEIGKFTAAGMAGGVDSGASKVRASMKSLLSIPANDNGRALSVSTLSRAGSSAAATAGGNGGGNVFHVTFGPGAFVVNARDGQDARSIAAEVRRLFLSELEELATGTG